MQSFVHAALGARIVFGRGAVRELANEVAGQGLERVLVLSTRQQRADAERLSEKLGAMSAGVFADAVMHTPTDVTEAALVAYAASGAHGVVSLGGGSTTGLGKAIAARTGAVQIAIPTTYAGSEVTPILGETADGVKTTRRGPEILPEVVIYDPDLTDSLPLDLSLTSGLNAMAHAAEGVYARDGSPIYSLMAVEGLRALRDALPSIQRDQTDRAARDRALYGAWLCGTVLGGVGMSIHHKLCHTLGGALDLPHASTHAILLPHTIGFVEAATDALAPVASLFGGRAGRGLHAFATGLGVPTRLADLGVTEGQLDALADLATRSPYWCPRPLTRDAIRALLQDAWSGQAPK
jgi:maleylacetate reductase